MKHFALSAVVALAALVMSLIASDVSRAQTISLPTGFNYTTVTSNMRGPTTAMAIAPDGRIFVTEAHPEPTTGAIRVIKNGVLLPTRFATVQVRSEIERGLIGIALDPNFATNQYVYVRYTGGSATTTPPTCRHFISRFTANGDVAAANSEVVLVDLGDCLGTGFHNGGALHFGPDGKLYTSIGDQNNCRTCAQSLTSIFGKLLRFNADGTIPTDNPFYNTTDGINRAIWAYGLRNPFNFAFQPGSGRLYINDVGGQTWEEINLGQAGANYGWPNCEGPCTTPNPNFTDPLYAYDHSAGCAAITGGAFYNPTSANFPSQYHGKYFFADWCRRLIQVLDSATGAVTPFASSLSRDPTALAVGADGALFVLGGPELHKIVYTALPSIAQQPASVTANAGEQVTFEIIAAGNPPLSYQWQRNQVNIPGATSPTYSLTATAADNGALFSCIVTNAAGNVSSESATLTVRSTANTPPTGTITQPAPDTFYRAGDVISFSGSANDPEDGELPESAFSWDINLHHNVHFHDFMGPLTGVTSGSFTLPTVDETEHDIWYRINLTVRDAEGSIHTSYRDVLPLKSTITIATDPPGLQLLLDAKPVAGPYSVLSVENLQRTLEVVSPQTLNGVTYEWVSWSDGGAASHNIATPTDDQTYTAVYQAVAVDDLIFADDFEAGNLNVWPSKRTDGGDLVVQSSAALVGSYGLLAEVDDNNMLDITDSRINSEKRYRARFYFDPNTIVMGQGDMHELFRGFTGTWPAIFQIQLRYFNGYQVRAGLLNDEETMRNSIWFNIADAPHFFEIDWRAGSAPGANDGALEFWVDGVLHSQLTGIDNDTRVVDRIRLGAISSVDTGTRGRYYFDAYASRRQNYIGPAASAAASTITIATDPAGLQATVDGQVVSDRYTLVSPENSQHSLGVVSPQTLNGVTYEWVSWSDGGAASHSIATPTDDQTYTAVYQAVAVDDLIFADDFEAGNLNVWPSKRTDGGDLVVQSSAALVGSYGLLAEVDDNNMLDITDSRINSEKRYRARFYFDPNTIAMGQGDMHELFRGFTGTWPAIFQIQLRYFNGYQVRAGLLNDEETMRNSIWFNIADAPHFFEIDWRASSAPGANDGALEFWVDGVLHSQLTGLDNDTRVVDRIRLGAISSVDTGTRGRYYFDAYVSRRQNYIGPAAGTAVIAVAAGDPAELRQWTEEVMDAESMPPAVEGELYEWTEEELGAEKTLPPLDEEENELPDLFLPWVNP